jgi:PAS domain S-box-containing protein
MIGFKRLQVRFSRSLLTQGLAATIALHTISACVLLGLFLFVQGRALEQQLELRGESMARFLANEIQFALLVGDRSEMQRALNASSSNADVLFLEIVNTSGQRICFTGRADLISSSGAAAEARVVPHAVRGFIEIRTPVWSPNRDSLLDWEPAGNRGVLGALHMGISMNQQRRMLRGMLLGGSGVILLGLAIMCSAQYWGLRRLLLPLAALVDFAHRVGSGDLGQRARVERADEVGQLAQAFNTMVQQLGETTVSRDYVDNVLRSMGESLILTARSGRIQRVNPKTVELLGYPEQELLGRPVLSLIDEDAAPPSATAQERTYRTRGGQSIPVLLSASELRNVSGAVDGFVWLAQDMRELKRTQAELVAARDAAQEANRAKSIFLANMSHELRTPLNAIIGYSQMLREDYTSAESESMRGDLEKIERSGHLLLGLINDILDLSKIEAGRETVAPQAVDVGQVLEDVCNTVAPLVRQQGNQLEVNCPDDARLAYADLSKFRQSVLNLVNNACKFTEKGRISIAVNHRSDAYGDWTEVHVSDTGIGIAPEHLAKLFQPFSQVDGSSTRKYNGTGLGLAISKNFCQMMGGDITVASEVGRGSCFSIRVPAGISEKTDEEVSHA